MKIEANIGLGVKVLKKHSVAFTYEMSKKTFSGTFILFLDKEKKDKITFNVTIIEGGYFFYIKNDGQRKVKIELKKIIENVFGLDDDLPELTINVKKPQLFFYYKKEVKSEDAAVKNIQSKYIVGLGAAIDVNLGKLPIAGAILNDEKAIAIKQLLALYASERFDSNELSVFNSKETTFLPEDVETFSNGFGLSMQIMIDGVEKNVLLENLNTKKESDTKLKLQQSISDKLDNLDDKIEASEVLEKKDNNSESHSAKKKWFKVDKKIGPVNLQRLGLAYDKGKIITLLDASIETNTLGMQLMGLGVGINLDWNNLDPEFYLDGLGLSYKTDNIEIAGSLMRTKTNGIDVYNGQARLKMKSFTLSAVGSYAEVNGERSLFIYGLYQGNIGGPPVFHVTAIAAGFGYNRTINAPEVSDIATFPLVALAMQPEEKEVTSVLASLETEMSNGKKAIEFASGSYWFAVGVKFTSFKIIESFLLLTANFNTKTEFNILGLSRLSWPEKTLRDKIGLQDPIVFVELAIKANYSPESEVIKVDGLISPNSYILSKDCQLSGGFAFYTWVSSENSGDFVMTIGGYHPRFPKPAHYPTVPRVALNWKLDDNLLVRGELYFALTPSAIMMGGRWELIYASSSVKAAFIMWIDILMQWAPFYYDISIGIILRIEANVKLLFVTVQLNLEIRAQLDIWGPPFSGKAEIDLGIYSFEIEFGSKEVPSRKPLQWNDFAKGFLPQEDKIKVKSSRFNLKSTGANTKIAVDCITASVTNGVIQCIEKAESDKLYITNPMQMQLAIDSLIPVTKLTFNNKIAPAVNDNATNESLGIKPCNFSNEDVDFEMNVSVNLGNGYVENLVYQKITKGFPDALWGSSTTNDNKEPTAPKVISNVMSGIQISAKVPEATAIKAFDFSEFVEELYPESKPTISKLTLNEKEIFNTRDVFDKMKNFTTTSKKREEIIKMLIDFEDFNLFENESLNLIYSDAKNYFRGTPKLAKIGHEAFNPTDTI